MTHQEKAKELVWKFKEKIHIGTPFRDTLAKQCALTCVDEIIKSIYQAINNVKKADGLVYYWHKVRQEIKTL